MGSRRLPGQALILAAGAALLMLAACGRHDNSSPGQTPATATAPASSPEVTPTPVDLLGPPPADPEAAEKALERYFGTAPVSCDDTVQQRWSVQCATGDLDGDGKADVAMLIPLAGMGLRSPDPAAVLVRRAGGLRFEHFPTSRIEADASASGRELFAVADRTGDARPELVYVSKGCTASTCRDLVEIQSWDGTAWRNVGPPDLGIENLETASFTGTGDKSTLVLRGGRLNALGAGPSRARTVTYLFDGTRYSASNVAYDPPEYLYHAVLDADALFEDARWDAAIAAYRAAVAAPNLRDWKYESQGMNGRAELNAYALFRIALATTAAGENPTSALDEVITASKDELFPRLAVAFRQGFQQGGSPQQGCLAVTTYLATPLYPRASTRCSTTAPRTPARRCSTSARSSSRSRTACEG
jgi:hypothetical protein